MGTTAVRIVANDTSRSGLAIQNQHASARIRISTDPNITTSTGIEVKPGAIFVITSRAEGSPSLEYYVISNTATTPVLVGRFFGKDGAAVAFGIDSGADVTLDSEGATGATTPASAILIGADDGTNIDAIQIRAPVDALANTIQGLIILAEQMHFNGTSWDRKRSYFQKEVTGITTAVAQASLDVSTSPTGKVVLQVTRTVGAANYIVDLEGSNISGKWVSIGTLTGTSADDAISYDGGPFLAYRSNVTTIGGGNTLTTNVTVEG